MHGRAYPTGRASIRHSFSWLNRQLAQAPQRIAKPKAAAPPTHKRASRLIHVYDTPRDVSVVVSRVHNLWFYSKNYFTADFPMLFFGIVIIVLIIYILVLSEYEYIHIFSQYENITIRQFHIHNKHFWSYTFPCQILNFYIRVWIPI